ncbi:MAG TPA: hypothetical protein VM328_05925, partial [Fimbriimonadaceae bacterium]|nr:hypothetical protein [Fimbriimonadaceae bacterium]
LHSASPHHPRPRKSLVDENRFLALISGSRDSVRKASEPSHSIAPREIVDEFASERPREHLFVAEMNEQVILVQRSRA